MTLFSLLQLGPLSLPNRIVMAPMTRSRAIGNLASELHRDYYAQRASAGLLISEGIAPSANGLGYSRIPGLFTAEQVQSWRSATDAVHAAGGRIVAQLMHTGRISHPLNQPAGARVLAPSAIPAGGAMYTDQQGPQPHPMPEAMSELDLGVARAEFAAAAKNAREAGFDGVELHGANGYLLEQFLHPHTNRRSDAYGGSVERRARFVLEVVDAVAAVIGRERLGIRLSPFNTYNDLPVSDELPAQYRALAQGLRGLLYVHLVQQADPRYPAVEADVRAAFGGPIILNGGLDAERAARAITDGRAALASFGRPFIANPDLVARFRDGAPLASPNPATFFTPGPQGYLDYAAR